MAQTKTKTKTKTARANKAGAHNSAERITAFKAFDANFACRGFNFEVGQTYKHDGPLVVCESGFHACENFFDVWSYYPMLGSRYAEVELVGPVVRHDQDSKIAAAEIVITAELSLPDFIKRATARLVAWITSKADSNVATGSRGHAAATGDSGHAAATGYSGHAAATGDSGHAAATGDNGHAAATGDSGHAAATGDRGIAAALGWDGTAKAGKGGAIMLAYIDVHGKIVAVAASKVGENGIKPNVAYRLSTDGEFIEAAE